MALPCSNAVVTAKLALVALLLSLSGIVPTKAVKPFKVDIQLPSKVAKLHSSSKAPATAPPPPPAAATATAQPAVTAQQGTSGTAQAPTRCDPRGFKPAGNSSLLYLYVWAGIDNAVGASAAGKPGSNTAKDFVATIDVTTGSPCFGQVISEADVPTSGNEPHHVGLNVNNTVLGVGGFNSWRYNQPSMYFFNVATDPAQPRYIKSLTPAKGAITDDFFRLPNGGFLVSLMGSTNGSSPGRVAEVDPQLNLVAEHPRSDANIDKFNPHAARNIRHDQHTCIAEISGLALTPPAINRMVTLDYVEYRTTFKPYTAPVYRTTARIWDAQKREIIKVVDLGPQAKGLMTARYIPNGKAQFLITAGHGVLYLLDAEAGAAKQIYDFRAGEGHCVLTVPFKNATRVLLSIYETDEVQLLDIADLNNVTVLQSLDLPEGAGPHATVLAPGDKLVAVSTYYVQHDHGLGYGPPFTNVNEKGVRLFALAEDGNSFQPHPQVPYIDFKNLFPHKGIARPHGMAFKAVAVSK